VVDNSSIPIALWTTFDNEAMHLTGEIAEAMRSRQMPQIGVVNLRKGITVVTNSPTDSIRPLAGILVSILSKVDANVRLSSDPRYVVSGGILIAVENR
jgi:hypothetical protein